EYREEVDSARHPLVAYIEECFTRARHAKAPIEERMIRNLYVYRCQYTPEKLAEIRELGGSEIYLPLGNIKARALKAWLTDIFFSNDEPPFDIQPTPVPELGSDMEEELQRQILDEVSDFLRKYIQLSELSGGILDLSLIEPKLRELIEEKKRTFLSRLTKYAEDVAKRFKKRIEDQFIEGGFFEALDECLADLAIYPAAILKSAIPRRVKVFSKNRQVVERVILTYNRVSPFDFFPSPTVSDFSDWVIEILHLTPSDLRNLKGIFGYNDSAIDYILSLYGDTGYRLTHGNQEERLRLEGKSTFGYNLIDIIEFWGNVKGELLKDLDFDFGIDVEEGEYYNVSVWVCDGVILKVVPNVHPLGLCPYHKASFIEVPDSFWGLSLIDVLYDLQTGVNALARAIINNAALSSGPMVERNIDRIPADEEKVILPWKIFDSSGLGFDSAPAYRFYQPQLTANALVQVIMYFMKLADELSGVPAYAHGDVTVGGAGRTSSGLAMLMQSASRGIKEVVKNVDKGIIEPAVRLTYYLNVLDVLGFEEEIPDLNIRAKGSIVLMEKMTQIQKFLELLQITSNPLDAQIIGIEGRKYLLENVFRRFGIEVPMQEVGEMVQALQEQLSKLGGQAQAKQAPKPKEESQANEEMAIAMQQEMLKEAGV
ncbi:MAG: hypothetical protein QXX12_03860, partial [Nanopusillaceae archaeon]